MVAWLARGHPGLRVAQVLSFRYLCSPSTRVEAQSTSIAMSSGSVVWPMAPHLDIPVFIISGPNLSTECHIAFELVLNQISRSGISKEFYL